MDILNLDQRVLPLQRELDLRLVRNQLISSNVANVDTPGYKARDLDFSRVLAGETEQLALRTRDERHLTDGEDGTGLPVRQSAGTARPDGNNVQIEEEMLKLTQNNIEYNALVQFISKYLSGVRRTIESIK